MLIFQFLLLFNLYIINTYAFYQLSFSLKNSIYLVKNQNLPHGSINPLQCYRKPLKQKHINEIYPLENDLIIRAAKGETIERTPIWLFRQAGRHLPEYNNYKKEKQKNFLELLEDPIDVTECTLQPVRRYNIDAAILFSDILVILQALGMEVTMPGGVGITVPNPLQHPNEVNTRLPSSVNIYEKLGHVIKAVELIKKELKGKVPLIGFSAAPFSLMYYMVGGTTKKNTEVATHWLHNYPIESKKILDLLTTIIIDYTSAQIEAGADMIQIFEAMGDFILETDFYIWSMPYMKRIATELKQKYPNIPLLVFPRGATYSIVELQKAGYDVVTIDTKTDRIQSRTSLEKAFSEHGSPYRSKAATLQGNFDVNFLKSSESSITKVQEEAALLLKQLGPQKLIANLGEGLSGQEDVSLVAAFVDSIHQISETIIKESKH